MRLRLIALALAVIAACALVLALAPHSPSGLRALVDAAGPAAPLALLVAWVVLTPALCSGTLLAAATGLVLGARAGVPVALGGATLGALAAFAIARVAAGGAARELAPPRVRALQARLESRPMAGIAALRAAPGVPATLLNYAAGLSRVRARDFAAGITLGGAPRVIAYTVLGGGLGHAGSPVALAATLGVVGLSALAAVAWGRRSARVAA